MRPNLISKHEEAFEASKDQTLLRIFCIACTTNILINLDHGILPACTKEIMQDANIGEVNLGLLGSLVFGGLIPGSLIASHIFQTYSAKRIMIVAGIGNILSLCLFPITANMLILSISRVLTGFFQVFFVIYFPVWVDIHAKNKRTRWLTYLQVSVPLGIFFGYALTAFFVEYINWRFSFYAQVILLGACVLSLSFFGPEFLNVGNTLESTIYGSFAMDTEDLYLPALTSGAFLSDDKEYSTLESNQPTALMADEDDFTSSPSKDSNRVKILESIKRNIGLLWKNNIYRYSLMCLTTIFFVITGLQFWISDYLRSVLNMDKEVVFTTFAFLTLTAPTFGVIIGGLIVDRLGGYTSKGAFDFVLICSFFSTISGLPIPYLNNFHAVVGLLWLLLFFGGGMMPAVTGIMISSVPRNMRAVANSIAQLCSNTFGYFPSPFLYGLVVRLSGGGTSRSGLIMLMISGVFGIVTSCLARRSKRRNILTIGDINALGLLNGQMGKQIMSIFRTHIYYIVDNYVLTLTISLKSQPTIKGRLANLILKHINYMKRQG